MTLSLRPEVQEFIDEQVTTGRFSSAEAVIEAAIAEMRQAGDELEDETIAAINEGLEQADRGEGIELNEFRAQFLKRSSGK